MSLLDSDVLSHAKKRVPESYLNQALQASQQQKSQLSILLEQGTLPKDGWEDARIEQLLNELALLDSNNFLHNVGVGEREARIYSGVVRRRHFGLGHGIGRSGDLFASQPKAAGSSLLYQLTASLTLDAVRLAGVPKARAVCVLPCATGMALMLSLSALAQRRPGTDTVLWFRCDQRSCLKAIHTAGLRVLVLEGERDGDEVVSDTVALERVLSSAAVETVRAVVSTSSCFAPRACDNVEKVAQMCQRYNVPHLINNAYGLQSTKLMHRIKEAARIGRVDGLIQSTDKNFMVPVGGAIIVDFDGKFSASVGSSYPGRASASPIVDLLATLLSMGRRGYPQLCSERNLLKKHLDEQLSLLASKHECCSLLRTPGNPISAALGLPRSVEGSAATALGSMLFTRGVSGARLVAPGKNAVVGNTSLSGWGSHHESYPTAYLTAAACVGMTLTEVDTFISRLDKCLTEWQKKYCGAVASPLPDAVGNIVASDASNTLGGGGCDVGNSEGNVSIELGKVATGEVNNVGNNLDTSVETELTDNGDNS